jgi:cell division control protein 6
MDRIDEIMFGKSICKDYEVLKPGYTPKDISEVKHRERIIDKYSIHMRPVLQNTPPSNLFLYGKSGTGKTLITNLMLNKTETLARKMGINFLSVVINCQEIRTDSKILRSMSDHIAKTLNVKPAKRNNDFGDFFEWFCKLVNMYGGIVNIVFDEIDKIQNPDLINSFSRMVENQYTHRNISLICIANDLNFRDRLDGRTLNVLCEDELTFVPYDAEQLGDILRARATLAFEPDVLDDTVIQLCAAYAAQEKGDARTAIELLRRSSRIAEDRFSKNITEEDVKVAHVKIEEERIEAVLESLPTQSKIVLLSILFRKTKLQEKTSTTGMIYEIYKRMCIKCDVDVLSQRRVTDLIIELDQLGMAQAIIVSKGRYGRTREIASQIQKPHLKSLAKDARIKAILDFDQIAKEYRMQSKQSHL